MVVVPVEVSVAQHNYSAVISSIYLIQHAVLSCHSQLQVLQQAHTVLGAPHASWDMEGMGMVVLPVEVGVSLTCQHHYSDWNNCKEYPYRPYYPSFA